MNVCTFSKALRFAGVVAMVSMGNAQAAPPTITRLSMVAGRPQLSITSDLGATNLVQTSITLSSTNWQTLTNLVVSSSPYLFTDMVTTPGPQRFYRVLAQASTSSGPPAGMVAIPAGTFQMGDNFNEGFAWEVPVHSVYVSAYYMDKYEVSKALWDQVVAWGQTNGYSFDYPGASKGPTHPVESIDWYDAAKWCNARSQMEGRVPSYYLDASMTQVYTSGQAAPYVNWHAGYRLPSEAEWERGARGGVDGHRFPWSDTDTITEARANYYSDPGGYSYDVDPNTGFNPEFATGSDPYTSPVGSFAPNAFGLYDMAGNVWEWCWDWAGNYPSAPQTDPHGPDTGSTRVGRGGNWNYYAEHCRNAYRYGNAPDYLASNIGFRCAMSAH